MPGAALVLGGAECVWSDIAEARRIGRPAGVVGCNHIGIAFPHPMDAWCSLHPDEFGAWSAQRTARGLPAHRELYGQSGAAYASKAVQVTLTDMGFTGGTVNGTSSLFACKVALVDLGFDRVVLCGAPMEDGPHFNGPHGLPHVERHKPAWIAAAPLLRDRVRSMGGWTRELLGEPTVDWFRG